MNETRSDREDVDSDVYCVSVPALDEIIINVGGQATFRTCHSGNKGYPCCRITTTNQQGHEGI
jgi:hypothetical protein